MAHSLSAKKRIRQNAKRRALNRARRTALKSKLKTSNEALQKGSVEDATKAVKLAAQHLDREANRGTLHRNAAARRKSRLQKKLNALKQKSSAASADR